jgi:hypothetical protein
MIEVIVIVSPVAAQGDGEREGLASSTCAPDPLLVVEALGRHVGHDHALQGANVDAHLHRGGDTEHIDTAS